MSGILLGLLLASIDIICFGFCKYIFINKLSLVYLILPSILYGFQIFLFYYGLSTNTVSILNIIWNVFSSLCVALLGILYFGEVLTNIQRIGVILGIGSILLFSL